MYIPSGGIPIEFASTILGLFIPALLLIVIFAFVIGIKERKRKRDAHKDSQQSESQKSAKHTRRKQKLRAAR